MQRWGRDSLTPEVMQAREDVSWYRGSPARSPRPFLGRGCEILDAKVKCANHTMGRATGGCGQMLVKV